MFDVGSGVQALYLSNLLRPGLLGLPLTMVRLHTFAQLLKITLARKPGAEGTGPRFFFL